MKDLAIVYRIYPGVSKVPPVYPTDKYKLSELCLQSFARSLKGIDAKIHVIFDSCPQEYTQLFDQTLSDFDTEYHFVEKAGNGTTFKMQCDLLLSQNDAEIVYFAEDDYFYLPQAFTEILKAIKNEQIDFLSPYDHLDYYKLADLHGAPSSSIELNGYKWDKRNSTTMTFMTKKHILRTLYKDFLTYSRGNYDNSMWYNLTTKKMLNPFFVIANSLKYKWFLKSVAKSYIHQASRLFFAKTYNFYSVTPSLATHMDDQCLAPNIDWQKEFNKLK